jgi:hypothetical protein
MKAFIAPIGRGLGHVIEQIAGTVMAILVPRTIGEMLFSGTCAAAPRHRWAGDGGAYGWRPVRATSRITDCRAG